MEHLLKASADWRILVLAPLRRDGPTIEAILTKADFSCEVCSSVAELAEKLTSGAAAALIAEEALLEAGAIDTLLRSLESQPRWSEPQILLVTTSGGRFARTPLGQASERANFVLLERPIRSTTLISSMKAALKARRRQYQVRDYLAELEVSEQRLRDQEAALRHLNGSLEARVAERTEQLEQANARLMEEMKQREQAERALRQAQKMEAIGQLTGGVAHDFNNLLMVISGSLSLLDRTSDTARRERLVHGIKQAAARAEALTKQLLAFSRRMTLSPQAVDLPSLLEGMSILVAGALREDIEVEVDLERGFGP
jgi:signal transduction histidine kinase